MKSLISYFIKFPQMGNVLMLLILVLGYIGLQNVNSATDPRIDPGLIEVNISYPGASPTEIEYGIVSKIENSLQGVEGIRKITSKSKENEATISVKVEEKFDTDQVLIKVKNAIDGISSFPPEMERIMVNRIEFSLEAVTLALTGSINKSKLLKQARKVEADLLAMNEISKVTFIGLPEPEIEIALQEDKMRSLQLSFEEVAIKIKEANIDLTGGTIKGKSEILTIRTKQKKYFAKELSNIIIRNSENGGLVYLSDIATLNETWRENPNSSYIDGKPSVSLIVLTNKHQDVVDASDMAKAYIKTYNQAHSDSQLLLLFDKSEEVSSMINVLLNNGLQGFVLVLLILSLFLNYRLSCWVAFGIPISMFGMFIIVALTGITFNTVSLFGMILILGVLVDDAVVVAESIYNHFLDGKTAIRAAIDGTLEVMPAVFSGVLTTIIAFSMLFYIEGEIGMFFVEMAIVIISALSFSLIEGFLILPAHVAESKALAKGSQISAFEKFFTRIFNRLRDKHFTSFLYRVLHNKTLSLCLLLSALVLTIIAMDVGIIRQGDVASQDANSFTIELEMPPGTPLSVTKKYFERIESGINKVADKYDKAREDTLKTLRFITINIDSENSGYLRGILQAAENRDYRTMTFVNEARKVIGEIPEAHSLNYVQKSFFGKPVSIELIHANINSLDSASQILETELSQIDGLKNVINNKKVGSREIEISLKPKAHALGISLSDLLNYVRNGFYGNEVMRFSRGKEDVRIMVRYAKNERTSITNLENMRVRLDNNSEIPLIELANFKYVRNLVEIAHYNGKRSTLVEADVIDDNVNLKFINEELENRILPSLISQFPNLTFYQSGMSEDMENSTNSIMKIGPVFLILLLIVILFTFRSKLQTLLVFCLIPFSFIGVAWGHAIHNQPIGMVSILGMVTLLGVMVNNAIILIDTYNKNLKKQKTIFEAVVDAAKSRFRPIILTTLTTVCGLFPLIFSNDSVAAIVVPMAITIAYGLIAATFLSLIILPIIIILTNKMRFYSKWFLNFEKPENFEQLEPALKELKHNAEL